MPRYRVEIRLEYSQYAYVEAENEEHAVDKVHDAIEYAEGVAGVTLDAPEYSCPRPTDEWGVEEEDEPHGEE